MSKRLKNFPDPQDFTHRLLGSSFLGLRDRALNIHHRKELPGSSGLSDFREFRLSGFREFRV